MDYADFTHFAALDIRAGTVTRAIKLWVDLGPDIGERKSSAQITEHYTPESLVGQRVMAVVNFAPRQIGPFMSDILVLGFPDANGAILLARPEASVADGARLA